MRLVGEGSEIGEGEEEGVTHVLNGVGDDWVSLRRGGIVKGETAFKERKVLLATRDEGRGGEVSLKVMTFPIKIDAIEQRKLKWMSLSVLKNTET